MTPARSSALLCLGTTRARVQIVLCVLSALFASACGSAAPVKTIEVSAEQSDNVKGLALRVVSQPSADDLVLLSLWVHVGSRNARPAQLATLAAFAAAERASGGADAPLIRPEVMPHLTSFEMLCPKQALKTCASKLLSVLRVTEIGEKTLDHAKAQLLAARRQAFTDNTTYALVLAGHDVGLSPLGLADADDAVDAAEVTSFLREFYGPSRAVMIAGGDLSLSELVDAASAPLDGLRARPTGALQLAHDWPSEDLVRSEAGDADVLAALIPLASPDAAHAAKASLDAQPPLPRHSRLRFETAAVDDGARGILTLTLRVPQDMPKDAGRRALDSITPRVLLRIARLMREPPRPSRESRHVDPPTNLRGRALQLAERWASEQVAPSDETRGVRLISLFAAGRGDGAAKERSRRRDRQEVPSLSVEEEWARLTERLEHAAGDAPLENGAELRIAHTSAGQVGLALLFKAGAGQDPAALHGRTALLATLAASSCQHLEHGQLDAELRRLGATMTPFVDAETWGIAVTAPEPRAREGLDLLFHCAQWPAIERGELNTARTRLLSRLTAAPAAAWTADMIAPQAPGFIAPWGAPDRIRRITPGAVTRQLADSLMGRRVTLVIAAKPTLAETLVSQGRARLATLPAGRPPRRSVLGRAAAEIQVTQSPNSETRVVAAWRVMRAGPDRRSAACPSVQAEAFAELVANELSRTHRLASRWTGGGCGAFGAWAAVEVLWPMADRNTAPTRFEKAAQAVTEAAVLRRAGEIMARRALSQSDLSSLTIKAGRGRHRGPNDRAKPAPWLGGLMTRPTAITVALPETSP